MLKLSACQLRKRKPTPQELKKIKRRPIYLILDNVLDTYNVGGLFRLADAVAVKELILCGETETPPSPKIHKAAVGLEEWIAWSYENSAHKAILNLKSKILNLKVVAIEQSPKSIPYMEMPKEVSGKIPIALVVGHETRGVSKNVLKIANLVVEIPMFGVNKSLNVIVSAAVVLYNILGKMPLDEKSRV